MPISLSVDHAEKKVFARAEGLISVGDIRLHLEGERAELGLSYSELIDARGYIPAFSAAEVRDIVAILRRLGESSRLGPTAVIVDTDLGYGMIRMLEILVGDVCAVRPFRDMEEGEQWLARAPQTDRSG